MKKIKIQTKFIGKGEPCFIVAEVGSNHNGKLVQAKKLIDIATHSKADAVKFQVYQADKMIIKHKKEIYELYKNTELPREWLEELKLYAKMRDIIFFCSAYDEEAVDRLDALDIPVFKVASQTLSHLSLLKYIARKGKPVILSTGMANLGDIEQATNAILEEGNDQIVLLHCGTRYPLKPEDVNLAVMETLKQVFPYSIGYSDHTLGISVSLAAVARGAKIIEKHFTMNRDLPGPDHSFALEPMELETMIQEIRTVEKAIGNSQKKVCYIKNTQ